MRTAIIHEWLDTVGGSEKVLEQILLLFPDADLFALVDFFPAPCRSMLHRRVPRTSFLQRLPFARKHFRRYLPLMPSAVERFDVSGYDLVISNSHAFAKGVHTRPSQTHVCYCHTPMRYAWHLEKEYLRAGHFDSGVRSVVARSLFSHLRRWDAGASRRVDRFLANSSCVAGRIRSAYGRDAVVVPPPVNTAFFQPSPATREQWYLTASRLVPYKRTDVLIEAFRGLPNRKLIIVGDGPELSACQRIAGPKVELRGYVPDEELRNLLQRARAFLFAAEEDFGILPVEAQACGTPVICYGRGGVVDTVVAGVTGIYFDSQTPAAIREAVQRFEDTSFDRTAIRANAERFSVSAFRAGFLAAVPSHV